MEVNGRGNIDRVNIRAQKLGIVGAGFGIELRSHLPARFNAGATNGN
jgi:hypothetical protein